MNIKDRIKSLRRVKSSDLLANPKNWRTHPKEQESALKAILSEVGIADAILAYETKDGLVVIDGHLRRDVDPDLKWPVLILDVTEEEADKILATHDPLGAMAGSNAEILEELLASMTTESEALQEMFDKVAAEAGIEQIKPMAEPVAEVDRAGELQKKWETKAGQVWILDGLEATHRIMCGDSTKLDDVSKLMNGKKPFLMVTDPPYGVEYDANWRDEFNEWGKPPTERDVENDDVVDWSNAYKLFPGVVAYVWHAGRYTSEISHNLRDAKFGMRSQIIWVKPTLTMSRGHYHWQHEPCWYAVRKGSAKWQGDRKQSTVWEIQGLNAIGRTEEREPHATQKPVECMARPIRHHGEKGDAVYDPFSGSGTTLIAAEQLGRDSYNMEISPANVAVVLERSTKIGCVPRLEEAKASNGKRPKKNTDGAKGPKRKRKKGPAKNKPKRAGSGGGKARVSKPPK